MESRTDDLKKLRLFISDVDTEMTMMLQHLQWDFKNIITKEPLNAVCKYNPNHRMPNIKLDSHEQQCVLRSNGYSNDETFLPEPFDANSKNLVKLSKLDTLKIIESASQTDPLFKKGTGNEGLEPQTLERLQVVYSADERRALHDAVVSAAPSCHDLSDLALLNESAGEQRQTKPKSRLEILAELRDMKRRRTKYRVAAKTRNYSDVLRDVIKTQMEVYSAVKNEQVEVAESQDVCDKYDKKCTSRNNFETEHHNKQKFDKPTCEFSTDNQSVNQSYVSDQPSTSNYKQSDKSMNSAENRIDTHYDNKHKYSKTAYYRDSGSKRRYDSEVQHKSRRTPEHRHERHSKRKHSDEDYRDMYRDKYMKKEVDCDLPSQNNYDDYQNNIKQEVNDDSASKRTKYDESKLKHKKYSYLQSAVHSYKDTSKRERDRDLQYDHDSFSMDRSSSSKESSRRHNGEYSKKDKNVFSKHRR